MNTNYLAMSGNDEYQVTLSLSDQSPTPDHQLPGDVPDEATKWSHNQTRVENRRYVNTVKEDAELSDTKITKGQTSSRQKNTRRAISAQDKRNKG